MSSIISGGEPPDISDDLAGKPAVADNNTLKIGPKGDYVMLEIVEATKTKGGLFIPDKAKGNQRDAQYARVMAIGPGRFTEYGALVKCTVKPKDYVLIARGAGVEVEHENNQRFRFIRDCEILATVEESSIITLGLVP